MEYLPRLLGDLEYRLRLGDGLMRRDLEYFLGDLPPPPLLSPLSILSLRFLEDDLCRRDSGAGLLL